MGLPKLHFDDASLGLPRQPVPVRLACFAADWSPALFAEAMRGLSGDFPPLLVVYEYDTATGHVGEVRPDAYEKIRRLKAPLPEALSQIPANHFVWSDDLVIAFSEFIDLTIDRESARQEGLGIRWQPALGESAKVVAEAVDFSALTQASQNRTYTDHGVRTFVFDGKTVSTKDSVGLAYISYLVLHPGKALPVQLLDRLVRPPAKGLDPATPEIADAIGHDEGDGSQDGLAVVEGRSDVGDATFDDEAVQSIKRKLADLAEQHEDQIAKGNHERAERIQDEMDAIERHLIAGRNKQGKSRRLGSEVDKMRKSVGLAISRALESLDALHPALAEHLRTSIRTGAECAYQPRQPAIWSN